MQMKKYWDKALTFEQYLEVNKQRLENPSDQQEKDFAPYYELAEQRMGRAIKTFKADPAQQALLLTKGFKGKVLIISEPWCGDASQTVPSVVAFFQDYNPVRIFLRDSDPSLIAQYLTEGTQSIPIVVLLDENYQPIAHWGPRPRYGQQLLKKFKADPQGYPKEEFYNDLQVYYAKNRGKDAIAEILELL